jgi:hypothetical protein
VGLVGPGDECWSLFDILRYAIHSEGSSYLDREEANQLCVRGYTANSVLERPQTKKKI